MTRRDLPLNALRAFEAAARHGGFVGAAEELDVTPAAVSHQIKGLEESLDVLLFIRRQRSVELTAAGRKLLPGLSETFDRLARLIEEVRPRHDAPITVAVPPSFGAKWLAPRLESFIALRSDITVRVQPLGLAALANPTDVDLAIGFEHPIGSEAIPLFEDWVFPVCAPVVRMALSSPNGLSMQVLLHDEAIERTGYCATWGDWLQAASIPSLKPAKSIGFSHATLAIEAAQRGQGVALGRGSLVVNELRSTSLARPFETAIPNGRPYLLFTPGTMSPRGAVAVFRDWLIAEADAFRRDNPRLVR